MISTTYQQCTFCIMDNRSDSFINFDEHGQCNYCREALHLQQVTYFPNTEGKNRLYNLLETLKTNGKNKKYDCVMGISGGLDSSYLAYLGSVQWGLRILAVHIDDGFDTEVSKRNIDRISQFPNLDLEIITPDPLQFHELTKAYMRANVPNLATPQDNVLFASIYRFMKENNLNTFLSGGNFALECILQKGNSHTAYDLTNLKDINNKFGQGKIDKLELISDLKRDIDRYIIKIKTIRPLNLINYNKDTAMKDLEEYCNFEYYGSKHLENELTKFIQQYWFYHKFNVDKRSSHLSSMIVSGQITREEALEIYNQPLYDEKDMKQTIDQVLLKLDMSEEEFDQIMAQPSKQHQDYAVSAYIKFKNLIKKLI